MPAPRHINIGPYSFPFTPSYTLAEREVGAAEREILDVARAERVRKKAERAYRKLRAASGRRTLSEAELRGLTETVAALDAEMTLERIADPRGAETQRPRLAGGAGVDFTPEAPPDLTGGLFEAEVARLAEVRVAAEEAARGITLAPPQREAALLALREDPLIRDAARARVEAALAERDRMVEGLF